MKEELRPLALIGGAALAAFVIVPLVAWVISR